MVIKKGFNISIGWNLSENTRSIQRLDPFTSTPMNGTKIKKIKKTMNKILDIFNNCFWLINENPINVNIPKQMNKKCLTKK